MRAYHDRKRHEIRLAARALVADVDGEPGDGGQMVIFSSRSTSALVSPMSSSRWSSSSASTRRCTECARLEVIVSFPMSFDCAAALATVTRIGIVRMSDAVDLVSFVS